MANEVALGFGERGTGRRTREDIAETVEENAFEGADGERNVEESIVDRGIQSCGADNISLADAASAELVAAYRDKCGRIGEFSHFEREGAHGLGLATHFSCDSEGDILPNMGGSRHILAVAFRIERTSAHAQVDFVGRDARCADGNGVVVAGIEHVHQIGGHGCTGGWGDDGVMLGEFTANDLAGGVRHGDISAKVVVSRRATRKL